RGSPRSEHGARGARHFRARRPRARVVHAQNLVLMPLIVAIEPDRQQASKLAALARGPLRAELILADSTERAFTTPANRVPDLILTSLLLSPKDEAALADRLRDLDSSGVRVQTLVIPVLSSSPRRSTGGKTGLLNKLRRSSRRGSAPDGCDPAVFA